MLHKVPDLDTADAEELKTYLLQTGGWAFIKQRPYDIIANPDVTPKAIFVSGYTTAPLAADLDYVLQGKRQELQAAVMALSRFTPGKIHISVGKKGDSVLERMKDVELHKVSGPHPAGLVGTQINKIDPVNKGEVVWTITPQDMVIMGRAVADGKIQCGAYCCFGRLCGQNATILYHQDWSRNIHILVCQWGKQGKVQIDQWGCAYGHKNEHRGPSRILQQYRNRNSRRG